MTLYIRCVWANKVTLTGYILFIAGIPFLIAAPELQSGIFLTGFMLSCCGFCIQLVTGWGFATVLNYKRAKMLISKGKSKEVEARLNSAAYCSRVGLQKALSER